MLKYHRFLKKAYNIWKKSRSCTSLGFLKQFQEMYKLRRLNYLEPEEYHCYHLYKDDLSWEEKTRFLSQFQYYLMESRVNPRKDVGALNKMIFSLFGSAIGLPVPSMYGVFEPHFGYTLSKGTLRTEDDLNLMFGKYPETTFVIKPISSYKGMGVLRCKFIGEGNIRVVGEGEMSIAELHKRLSDSSYSKQRYVKDSYIVEKAVCQHPFLDKYCDTTAQTLRTVTYITSNGEIQVLATLLKIARWGSAVDNVAISNIGARVNPDGVMEAAVSPQKNDIIIFENHPDTDAPIKGETLPYYNEAVEIAKEAHSKVHHLRSIGWDIAISDKGPVIIEGNFGWDQISIQQVTRRGIIEGEFEVDLRAMMKSHLG